MLREPLSFMFVLLVDVHRDSLLGRAVASCFFFFCLLFSLGAEGRRKQTICVPSDLCPLRCGACSGM